MKQRSFYKPIRNIFIFSCFSGLRFSDAHALSWSYVNKAAIYISPKYKEEVETLINDLGLDSLGAEKEELA